MSEVDFFYIKYSVSSLVLMSLFFAIIHVGYFRLKKVKNILRATLVHGIISALLGIIMTHILYGYIQEPVIAFDIVNFALFCAIVFAYGSMGPIMADRSVSVFLLILLDEDREGKGSGDELANRLGGHAMFDKRYFEHEDVGALKKNGDTLTITPKGRRIAKFYMFLINLLKLKKNY